MVEGGGVANMVLVHESGRIHSGRSCSGASCGTWYVFRPTW